MEYLVGAQPEPERDPEPVQPSLTPIGDALAATTVTVHTPNEQVFGSVVGLRDVRVWFAPGYYQRTAATVLEQNLAALAKLLFVAGVRERGRVSTEVSGQEFTRRIVLGHRAETYDAFLRDLTVEVVSADGSLTVTAVGQSSYAVRITPGTLERVPQEVFEASCGEVATRLVAETEVLAARARWETFDPIPGITLADLDSASLQR